MTAQVINRLCPEQVKAEEKVNRTPRGSIVFYFIFALYPDRRSQHEMNHG
ncbi:MAG: hypothetical protein WCJ01_07130 [Ignavibacteria bacterium]